ncbi:MAG: basic amino acid transporter substrate-binding protein, partial [Paenibacillus sp.]|nr:basic amino acid transporter substrate-binding protein [Paenibacillus sp.]
MKKLLFFVLTAVLVVALAGCGSKESGGTKYKFATDAAYAPMEYMDKDKMTGFDIDFLAEV